LANGPLISRSQWAEFTGCFAVTGLNFDFRIFTQGYPRKSEELKLNGSVRVSFLGDIVAGV
jgi:hypothetical protein